jgi:hypothetical protein
MIDDGKGIQAWRAHPARERPAAAACGLGIIAAVAAAAWWSFGAGWAIGSLVVLVLALNRFFFPSRFSIDAQGIAARYLLRSQRVRWAHVRRFAHDERGGYLSTRGRPSRLDAYSGVHVLFGAHRDEVIQAVRRHMKDAREPLAADHADLIADGGRSCLG